MSEKIDKEMVIAHKKLCIRKINNLFEGYINSEDIEDLKKVNLLSYWLENFSDYIRKEKDFDVTRLKAYKRGDVIKLNFGFNVGREYGGLHYAVVINNNNPRNSAVLTVIPLTSFKEGKEVQENDVFLGNEIYRSLKLKHDTILKSLEGDEKVVSAILSICDKILNVENKNNTKSDNSKEVALDLRNDLLEKQKKNIEIKKQIEKIGTEIKKMKQGSIALVEQITTVSKMRIYDPRNSKGVLSGIRLSPDAMDKINKQMKKLYIF